MHQSVRTIDSPEFINLQPLDINPLMSSCDIKVLYVGQNRNRSYISKEVAVEMAKTLRGAPIVGYYKEQKEDYADHGERVTIDDEGIHFDCMTKPYGFVAPNAEVWFQKFEDTDPFGNTVVREYLMTTGYLWTEQFPEAKLALEGRPQSMELDEKSLNGSWAEDVNNGLEFFIINDAIFSKLCILGDDVEPCFEGASITAQEGTAKYSLDKDFKTTLFSMVQDLKKFALEGGQQKMDNVENIEQVNEEIETPVEFTEEQLVDDGQVSAENEFKKEDEEKPAKDESDKPADDENLNKKEDSADNKDKEEKTPNTKSTLEVEDENGEISDEAVVEQPAENMIPESEFTALQEKYNELNIQFTALKNDYDALVEFKNNIDNQKKDELINSFSMLSDDAKADVITNKAKYSYDEIESKLSIAFARMKINEQPEQKKENGSVTFAVDSGSDDLPAWLQAVRANENNL